MTPEALQALADFLPAISDPAFVAGEMRGGKEIEPGVIEMFFADYGPVALSFEAAAYARGWVIPFDWSEWAHSPEGQGFAQNPDAIRNATGEQLAKLITVFVRQDRFVEGCLLRAFKDGFILRIVEQAANLCRRSA